MYNNQDFISKAELCVLLTKIEYGLKTPDDEYFIFCDQNQEKFCKQGILAIEEEGNKFVSSNSVPCTVHGCTEIFDTVFAYESHYNSLHRFLCSQCKKNLPSSHLLDLHLSEKHDSYFAALAEKKPMYACYIQECKKKCFTQEQRMDHCVRVHKFPPKFRFETKSNSSLPNGGGGATKKKEKKSKIVDTENQMVNENLPKNWSITFGQQKTKVFNENNSYAKILTKSKTSDKKNTRQNKSLLNDDSNTMSELMESLP